MNRLKKGRNLPYGIVAVFVTLLVLAAVVIFNVIAGALAGRYEWMYINMNTSLTFEISDDCKDYLSETVIPEIDKANASLAQAGKSEEKITLLFCDNEENIEAEQTRKYILESAQQLLDMFPDYIKLDYMNIWEEPSRARALGVTASTDVVCMFNGRHETMTLTDFYVFEDVSTSTPTGYNGEKIFASCLMRVTQEYSPMCYVTANHGESFDDYEFMRAIVEAGYTISFIDLSMDEIPEDCDLLVTFDPKQDLIVSDAVSGVSEVQKIDDYMSNGGKYMVFLSADTFVAGSHENLETLLADWGVTYKHETGDEGIENCHLIRDLNNSLSVDGYTILARIPSSGLGASVMSGLDGSNVFGRSTAIAFAEDFTSDGNGNYVKGARTAFPLMVSHGSAEAWMAGRAVARASEDPFVLMSMSIQDCDNGEKSYLIASASTEFGSAEAMQSTVIDNSKTLTGILSYMGKDNAPVELTFKSFGSDDIESLTTFHANLLTVILTAAPALVCLVAGIFVLVRRKNS